MRFKKNKLWSGTLAMAMVLLLLVSSLGVTAFAEKANSYKPGTYTVTANLYIDGKDNQILKGTTAYITNTAFPPTSPVENNASLEVKEDGTMYLTIKGLNPIVQLQKIDAGSGAEVVDRYYTGSGDSKHIDGVRIRLDNDSGKYRFAKAEEKPSVVNSTFQMPLSLSVDFSTVKKGVPVKTETSSSTSVKDPSTKSEAPKPIAFVQSNPVKQVVQTVKAMVKTIVDQVKNTLLSLFLPQQAENTTTPNPVVPAPQSEQYTTPVSEKTVPKKISKTEPKTQSAKNSTQKKVKKQEKRTSNSVKPGRYRVSANIWFSKEATGLPMNPHITNGAFPPSEPVSGNATLIVDNNGNGQVTVPIRIQPNIMSVTSISGLPITSQTRSGGRLTGITVSLGKMPSDRSSIRRFCSATINMGDLAVQISGLSKTHTWPATFEMDFHGLPSSGGGALSAAQVKALQQGKKDEQHKGVKVQNGKHVISGKGKLNRPGEEEKTSKEVPTILGVTGAVAVAAAIILLRRKLR